MTDQAARPAPWWRPGRSTDLAGRLPGSRFSQLMPVLLIGAFLAWLLIPFLPQPAAFLVYGVTVGVYGLYLLGGQYLPARLLKSLAPLLALMGALYLSLNRTHLAIDVLIPLINQSFLFVFALMSAHLFVRTDTAWVFQQVLLAAALLVAISVALFLAFGTIRPETISVGEVTGSFSNKLTAVNLLLLPFAVLGWKLFPRQRLYWQLALFGLTVTVLAAESRAGLILLVIGYGLCFRWFEQRAARRLAVYLIGAFMAAVILLAAPVLPGGDKITEPLERLSHLSTFSDLAQMGRPPPNVLRTESLPDIRRAVMYYEGVKAVREHPVTGVGYRGIKQRMEEYYGVGVISHNIILTAWGEFGLVGLLALIATGLGTVLRCRRFIRLARRAGDSQIFYFCQAMLTALLLGWIHAMARPQESNFLFMSLVAVALALPAHPAMRRLAEAARSAPVAR